LRVKRVVIRAVFSDDSRKTTDPPASRKPIVPTPVS
jgi:hypothetical protein